MGAFGSFDAGLRLYRLSLTIVGTSVADIRGSCPDITKGCKHTLGLHGLAARGEGRYLWRGFYLPFGRF